MATFSAIASSEYAVGAPITSSWGSKVSNNVLAIIQGDATASTNRIQTNALATGAVTYAKMTFANDIVAGDIAASAVGTTKLAALAVTTAKIATNANNASKINLSSTSAGSQSIAASGLYTLPVGLYSITGVSQFQLEIYDGTTWRASSAFMGGGGTLLSDGTNMRVRNLSAGALTLYYRKLS